MSHSMSSLAPLHLPFALGPNHRAICIIWLTCPSTTPPFDRHDWIVTRPDAGSLQSLSSNTNPTLPRPKAVSNVNAFAYPDAAATKSENNGKTSSTRYVIDYYSAPPDEEGNPVFHLDVRPAVDDLKSMSERVRVGAEDWMKGEAH